MLVVIVVVASELRQESYSNVAANCTTDAPYAVMTGNRRKCAVECLHRANCRDFYHKSDIDECALFLHKPLFFDFMPGCVEFEVGVNLSVLQFDERQRSAINGCSTVVFIVFKHVQGCI